MSAYVPGYSDMALFADAGVHSRSVTHALATTKMHTSDTRLGARLGSPSLLRVRVHPSVRAVLCFVVQCVHGLLH